MTYPLRHRGRWIISADLGQSLDPTAIAVGEVVTRQTVHDAYWAEAAGVRETMPEPPREWYVKVPGGLLLGYPNLPTQINIRHLERLPLRMDYVAQIQYIAALVRSMASLHPELILDSTGVDRGPVDIARRAGLRPMAITITAGNAESKGEARDEWHVSKSILVQRLSPRSTKTSSACRRNWPKPKRS